MKFLIVHGAFGSPEGNWFPSLRERLLREGHEVIIPRFPVDGWEEVTRSGPETPSRNQTLTNWLGVMESEALPLLSHEPFVAVGHSLGPLFILHALSRFQLRLRGSVFVCPFLTKLNGIWQIDHANSTFYSDVFDFQKLKSVIGVTHAVYSDDDPYVPVAYAETFAQKIGAKKHLVKGGKHLNSEAGVITLPLVEELCMELAGSGA